MNNVDSTLSKASANKSVKGVLFYGVKDEVKTIGIIGLVIVVLFLAVYFLLSMFMKSSTAFSFTSMIGYIICLLGALLSSILLGIVLVKQYFVHYCSIGFSRGKIYKVIVLQTLILIFVAYIIWLVFFTLANHSSILSIAEDKEDVSLLYTLTLHNKAGIFTEINVLLSMLSIGAISILTSIASNINKFIKYSSIIIFWFLYFGICIVKQVRSLLLPFLGPYFDYINTPYISVFLSLIIIASLECGFVLCKKLSL